jgi:hypothetical protein
MAMNIQGERVIAQRAGLVRIGGTNGLRCLSKHGVARDIKFLVTHPMTDQRCLTSAIARTDRGALELL